MSEKMCRLCLGAAPVEYSLEENDGFQMLQDLTDIEFTETEKSGPNTVCGRCWANLKLAHKIREDFIEANRKFRHIEFSSDEDMLEKVEQLAKNIDQDIKHELAMGNARMDVDPSKTIDTAMIKEEIVEAFDPLTLEADDVSETADNEPAEDDSVVEVESQKEEIICIEEDDGESSSKVKCNCLICGGVLPKESIEEHVKQHFVGPQLCDVCDLTLPNIRMYRNHMLQLHGGKMEKHTCTICKAVFHYKSLYNIHMDKAHDKPVAPKKKLVPTNALLLSSDTLNSNTKILCCPTCSKKYDRTEVAQFKQHVRIHERKECPICKAQITVSNLRKHIQCHTVSPTVCHLCGATYKNMESLRGHMHYTHSTKKFECEHCKAVFKKSYSLTIHIKKEHTDIRDHICETCGKCFHTKYSLTKHINSTHLKLRPYVCKFCKRGFSSRFAMRTHERQHTNDAPYKCEICSEGFRQKVSLRAHKKSKHDVVEEKNCECKVCGKMFVSIAAVRSHMRLHL